jgi:hypothetical protein
VADSTRSGRALGTAITSAVASNVGGVWLFLTLLDALPQLSRSSGIRFSLALPAVSAAVASALAYEVLIRLIGRLRRSRPVDAAQVRAGTQAQLMLAASTGAGLMLGLILQSTAPTESWDLFVRACLGMFWGFACGILSASLVWLVRRISPIRRRRSSAPPN